MFDHTTTGYYPEAVEGHRIHEGDRAFITLAADGQLGEAIARIADYLLMAAIEYDWINSPSAYSVDERIAGGIVSELRPEPELVPHAW